MALALFRFDATTRHHLRPLSLAGIEQLTEARLGVLHGPDLHYQIPLMTSPMTSLRPRLLQA